ncbi:MAG: hypothetical protein ABI333_22025 [bacterium]
MSSRPDEQVPKIAKGVAGLDAGLGEELTDDVVADIKRMGRSRAADGDQ